jgi:opacity protein-like surface antigen
MNFITKTLLLAASVAITSTAMAADSSPTPQKKPEVGHGKNLNFDGDYVETMGKNSLDWLTALS